MAHQSSPNIRTHWAAEGILTQEPNMRRQPLAQQLGTSGMLRPPDGYTPPKDVQELLARIESGETYFCGSNFTGQLFENVTLSSINLHASKFDGATFSNVTFDQVRLPDATYIGATFSNCTLEHCIMMQSDLFKARIAGSQLLFCDLRGSFFGETEFFSDLLFGNWLSQSTFFATRFLDTSITLNDLAETKHPREYSIIDVATIKKSAAMLIAAGRADYGTVELNIDARKILEDIESIERFFGACGIPHDAIDLFRRWITSQSRYQSIFISYSTQDEQFARELDRELRKRGIDVWFAPHSIRGGRTIIEQVTAAIGKQERTVLVLSEASIQSGWVETEIRHALSNAGDSRRLFPVRLVPFERIRGWSLFDADSGRDLAKIVREFYIPDFSEWKDEHAFLASVERLCDDLKATDPEET